MLADNDDQWGAALDTDVFQSVMACCADGIVIVDRDHVIARTNAAAEALFGYAPDALAGQSVHDLLPPRFRRAHAALLETLWRRASRGRHVARTSRTIRAQRADGTEFLVDVSILRAKEAGRPVLMAVVRERRRYQALEREITSHSASDPGAPAPDRPSFETRADAILASCQRRRSPLGLALFHIDTPESQPTHQGHAASEAIKQRALLRLRDSLRGSDLIGRFGHERFGALLTGTDHQGAVRAIERACSAITSDTGGAPVSQPQIVVTVTAGAAVTTQPPRHVCELIPTAVVALNEAKAAGGSRVQSKQGP